MSPAVFAVALAVALAGFAIVLNHCHARLALVELALNEGLPPGYQITPPEAPASGAAPAAARITQLLGPGVHVFLSRNCHACQRLLEEIDQTPVHVESELHLHYVDRPRPLASSAAAKTGATLHEQHAELASHVGADPLPFTVAVGTHGLLAQAVTPTVGQVSVAARDAGIAMDIVSSS